MRGATLMAIALTLAGCSGSFELGRPGRAPFVAPPPGAAAVIEPNGEEVITPAGSPIETVITGLSQAQQVRTLTRQLAR
jgi:hypothetical protein